MKSDKSLDLRDPFKVPSALDVSEPYRVASERQQLLEKLYESNINTAAACRELLAKGHDLVETDEADRQKKSLGSQVAKLLGIADGEEAESGRSEPILEKAMRGLEEAQTQIRAIDAALVINGRELTEQFAQACAQINEKCAPQLRALARDVCMKLISLHSSTLAYAEAIEQFGAQGIRLVTIRPLVLHACGDPRDRYSAFADFLHLCKSEGVITREEIPSQLKISESDR